MSNWARFVEEEERSRMVGLVGGHAMHAMPPHATLEGGGTRGGLPPPPHHSTTCSPPPPCHFEAQGGCLSLPTTYSCSTHEEESSGGGLGA